MNFKIDTKENYSILTPEGYQFDAALAADLRQKWEMLTEKGHFNLIIDLVDCHQANEQELENWLSLHQDIYEKEQSLILTHLPGSLLSVLKQHELDESLNITPTLVEAIDMVNMEILERDLFNES